MFSSVESVVLMTGGTDARERSQREIQSSGGQFTCHIDHVKDDIPV
jgi:hypothetical protein